MVLEDINFVVNGLFELRGYKCLESSVYLEIVPEDINVLGQMKCSNSEGRAIQRCIDIGFSVKSRPHRHGRMLLRNC